MRITVDTRTDDRMKQIAQQFPKATASALNKMGKQVKTYGSELVRAQIKASKRSVDKTFKIIPATPDRPVVVVKSTGRAIALVPPHATQTTTGVTVRLTRLARIRHAFIATMPSGHQGTFMRFGPKRQMTRGRHEMADYKRQAIFELTGPSVPSLLGSPTYRKYIKDFVKRHLPDILKHEINFWNR